MPIGEQIFYAIDVGGGKGNWVPKKANSSFFPSGWDETKVLEEIAFVRSKPSNQVTDRIWNGDASDGTNIQVEYTGPLNNLTFSMVYPTN